MSLKIYDLEYTIFPKENETQRKYPFKYNPVINILKTEKSISEKRRGIDGFEEAQDEMQGEKQHIYDKWSKKKIRHIELLGKKTRRKYFAENVVLRE